GGGDTCETMANIIVDHLQAFGVDTARVTQESESPRATIRYTNGKGHHLVVFESNGKAYGVVHGDDIYRRDLTGSNDIVVEYSQIKDYWAQSASAQVDSVSDTKQSLML